MERRRIEKDPSQAAYSPSHAWQTRMLRIQRVELLVFLFLILPSLAMSLLVTPEHQLNLTATAFAMIFRDLALVALVLYLLWRNGEPPQQIGLRRKHALREVGLGILLFPLFSYPAIVLENILREWGIRRPEESVQNMIQIQGVGGYALALTLLVVVAVSEEIIFRGYLLRRLIATTGRTYLAVALSSVIFSLGHGYAGALGLLASALLGFLLALVYLWRGSLVAPITLHFIQNFLGVIVSPLLGGN